MPDAPLVESSTTALLGLVSAFFEPVGYPGRRRRVPGG